MDTGVDEFEESVKKFVEFRNFFSVSAYEYISEYMPSNCVISPFLAECFLTLMQLGARGQTAEEIEAKFHHIPHVESYIPMALYVILTTLTTENFHKLEVATKIYVDYKYEVNPNFKHIVEDFCNANIENVFFTQQCVNAMDQWIQDRISNSFEKNITDYNMVSPNPKMVLVNGANFKGRWKLPFSKKDAPMQFFTNATKSVEIKSMTSKGVHKYYYFDNLKIKMLDIEFKSQKGEASLVLIMPDVILDLVQVERNIIPLLNLNRQALQPTLIELELPMLKIETMEEFRYVFNECDIQKIFRDEADLSGISDKKGLCLTNFIQKVVLDLDEEGINVNNFIPNPGGSSEELSSPESSSADSPHLCIKVDRPFAFYIKMRNVIVLIGRFTNPTL